MSKYIIGMQIIKKDLTLFSGYYCLDKFHFIYSPNIDYKDGTKGSYIYVCETAEAAKEMCKYLRKKYEYEFKEDAKKYGGRYSDYRFWPKKVESSTTPLILEHDYSDDNQYFRSRLKPLPEGVRLYSFRKKEKKRLEIKTHTVKKCKIDDQYYNKITDKLNEYLLPGYQETIKRMGVEFGSYLLKYSDSLLSIRVPGATRGHIETENDIIKNIEFYDTADRCYSGEYKTAMQEYIGSILKL